MVASHLDSGLNGFLMKLSFLGPSITLICAGILLGFVARMVLGVPDALETSETPAREISRPLPEKMDEVIDLPILRDGREVSVGDAAAEEGVSGVVPPIQLPGQLPFSQNQPSLESPPTTPMVFVSEEDQFAHDPEAVFHSHGEKVCASGCAASNHPTEILSEDRFWTLLDEYKLEPMDQTNNALEALLYYGPQTQKFILDQGVGSLDRQRTGFLWEQLKCNKVKVSLRLVDNEGEVRSWLEPTSVPFDRRHVFDMKTNNLQSLVTSGTVKRVGLNHAWVRL